MQINRFYTLIMISVIGVLLYLNYQVFQPFLTSIAWALVFGPLVFALLLSVLEIFRTIEEKAGG